MYNRGWTPLSVPTHLQTYSRTDRTWVYETQNLGATPNRSTIKERFMLPNPIIPWKLKIHGFNIAEFVGGEKQPTLKCESCGRFIGRDFYEALKDFRRDKVISPLCQCGVRYYELYAFSV